MQPTASRTPGNEKSRRAVLFCSLALWLLASWLLLRQVDEILRPGFDFLVSRKSAANWVDLRKSVFDRFRTADYSWLKKYERQGAIEFVRERITEFARSPYPTDQVHFPLLVFYFEPTVKLRETAGFYYLNLAQAVAIALGFLILMLVSLARDQLIATAGTTVLFLLLASPFGGFTLPCGFIMGQTNSFSFLGMAAAVALVSARFFRASGVALALAACEKIFPGLMIFALPPRLWFRAAGAMVLTTLAIATIYYARCGAIVIADIVVWPLQLLRTEYNPLSAPLAARFIPGNFSALEYVTAWMRDPVFARWAGGLILAIALLRSTLALRVRRSMMGHLREVCPHAIVAGIVSAGFFALTPALVQIGLVLACVRLLRIYAWEPTLEVSRGHWAGLFIATAGLFPLATRLLWPGHLLFYAFAVVSLLSLVNDEFSLGRCRARLVFVLLLIGVAVFLQNQFNPTIPTPFPSFWNPWLDVFGAVMWIRPHLVGTVILWGVFLWLMRVWSKDQSTSPEHHRVPPRV